MAVDLRAEEITEIIRQQLSGIGRGVDVSEIGTVVSVGDGIARVYGLDRVMAGELVQFPHDIAGLALNLEEDNVGVVLLGEASAIKEGDEVKRTGKIMSVPVGPALIGRVVNPLGIPIDGKGPINTTEFYPIERLACLMFLMFIRLDIAQLLAGNWITMCGQPPCRPVSKRLTP